MIKRNQRLLNAFNLIADGILIAISYFMAAWLRFDVLKGWETLHFSDSTVILTLLVYCICMVLMYYVSGIYGADRIRRKREEGLHIVVLNGIGTLAFMALCYVMRFMDFSRLMLILFWLISSALVVIKHTAVRAILSYYRRKGYNLKYVIVIGSGQLAYQYVKDIEEHPQLGYKVKGYIGDVRQSALGKHLGTYAEAEQILAHKNPDEVVIALDPQDIYIMPDIMSIADKEGVRLSLVPLFNDFIPKNPSITSLGRTMLVDMRATRLDHLGWAMAKRAVDIVGSLVLIVLFSPVMLVVALGVKLSGPGQVLFYQERVGKYKKPFKMIKFRSMRENGTEKTGWSTNEDPRKTRFGSLIRKFSLDELPQFFNVLVGDMSLVGPRPEVPHHVRHFKEEVPMYLLRQQVRPGITGWAQVNGLRGDTSIEDRVQYDLWYIENWSIWLDLKILLKTAFGGMINKESLK